MLAPNLKTVCVFGIVAISMQLVVIPFLKVPQGPEMLAPFLSVLGSTSWYLPALAYASDRHVTDVISVMSRQSCVKCLQCICFKAVYPNIHGILSRL